MCGLADKVEALLEAQVEHSSEATLNFTYFATGAMIHSYLGLVNQCKECRRFLTLNSDSPPEAFRFPDENLLDRISEYTELTDRGGSSTHQLFLSLSLSKLISFIMQSRAVKNSGSISGSPTPITKFGLPKW